MNDDPFILVVDDEPANRRLAAGILRAFHWNVDEAEDGQAAVEAMRQRSYALVLMDIQMPDMDGFAATRAIREGQGAAASVPILAFTAIPSGDAIERARAAGMDGHIAKPFTPEMLRAAVERWRPAAGPSPAASLMGIFGAGEIAGLVGRFRLQLEDALTVRDDDDARRALAHKIAGISGTLGFADVSRSWLAVSEGDDAAWEEARASARRAIHCIDREGRSGT